MIFFQLIALFNGSFVVRSLWQKCSSPNWINLNILLWYYRTLLAVTHINTVGYPEISPHLFLKLCVDLKFKKRILCVVSYKSFLAKGISDSWIHLELCVGFLFSLKQTSNVKTVKNLYHLLNYLSSFKIKLLHISQ